jgi:hypothetical protein
MIKGIRIGKLACTALLGFVISGCCVLPWGEGRRDRGHYGHQEQSAPPSHHPDHRGR